MRNRSSIGRAVPPACLLLFARGFLALAIPTPGPSCIRLDVLLPLAILPGELVGHDALAVLFDKPPIPLFAGQARVHLEYLHRSRWSRGPSRRLSVRCAARRTCSRSGVLRRLPDAFSPARRTCRSREAAAPAQRGVGDGDQRGYQQAHISIMTPARGRRTASAKATAVKKPDTTVVHDDAEAPRRRASRSKFLLFKRQTPARLSVSLSQ